MTTEATAPEVQPDVTAAATASTWQRIVAMLRVLIQLPKLVLTIIENQGAIAQALQSQTAILSQLNARVSWYEHRVPLVRKEYFAFKEQEKTAIEKVKAKIDYDEREKRRAAGKNGEMAVVK